MARSSASSVGNTIGALWYVWAIVMFISAWLKVGWWLAAIYLISLGLLIYFVCLLLVKIRNSLRVRRNRLIKCAHGILNSGATCQICIDVAVLEQQRRDSQRAGEIRIKQIREEAVNLLHSERVRLHSFWRMKPDSFFEMHHRDFEDEICDLFRHLGYEATRTSFSKDGGKDGILFKDGKKFVLECKRYAEGRKTGRRELQILRAAMMDESADAAIFVTTGTFTTDAIDYSRKNKLELYDRKSLPLLVNKAFGPPAELIANTMCLECGNIVPTPVAESEIKTRCPQGHPVTCALTFASLNGTSSLRVCVRCSAPMRLIKYRNSSFWGCTKYPGCRYRENEPRTNSSSRSWKVT